MASQACSNLDGASVSSGYRPIFSVNTDVPAPRLQKGLGPLDQLVQSRLVRVSRLAGVDDGNPAAFGRLHQLPVGSGARIANERLLVGIVGKHFVVDLGALIAARASRGLYIGLVRRPGRGGPVD